MNTQYLTQFIEQIKIERQLSVHTQNNYFKDISYFLNWLQQSEYKTLDAKQIQYYLAHLNYKKLAPTSIARKLSAIRQFFHFLIGIGVLNHNPATSIKAPKKKQLLPKAMAVDDINQFLNSAHQFFNFEKPTDIRNYAILELFYASGMRLSELTSLNLNDINFSTKSANIIGKGNKERIIHLGQKASNALNLWLKYRPLLNKNPQEIAFFISNRGKRLSQRMIQVMFKDIGKQFNINLNLHPHMMRHSFGSHILQSGADLRVVQELLGHQDIASTQIYTHLDFQYLASAYDKSHPRAKKSTQNSRKKPNNSSK